MIRVTIEMDEISKSRVEQDAFLAKVCEEITKLSPEIKNVKVVKVMGV